MFTNGAKCHCDTNMISWKPKLGWTGYGQTSVYGDVSLPKTYSLFPPLLTDDEAVTPISGIYSHS
jgi:hypothetical protein